MHVPACAAMLLAVAFAAQAASGEATDVRVDVLREILNEPLALRGREAAHKQHRHDGHDATKPASHYGLLSLPVALHHRLISPQDGDPCTFVPSCSEYAVEAVRRHGLVGWVLASDRLLRCNGGNWGDYPHVGGRKLDPVVADGPANAFDASQAAKGATLSLVPGLGQITAGRSSDGLNALMTVGILAFGAAAYAHRDQPIPAAAAASAAAFFYIGNLYGGATAHGRNPPP